MTAQATPSGRGKGLRPTRHFVASRTVRGVAVGRGAWLGPRAGREAAARYVLVQAKIETKVCGGSSPRPLSRPVGALSEAQATGPPSGAGERGFARPNAS